MLSSCIYIVFLCRSDLTNQTAVEKNIRGNSSEMHRKFSWSMNAWIYNKHPSKRSIKGGVNNAWGCWPVSFFLLFAAASSTNWCRSTIKWSNKSSQRHSASLPRSLLWQRKRSTVPTLFLTAISFFLLLSCAFFWLLKTGNGSWCALSEVLWGTLSWPPASQWVSASLDSPWEEWATLAHLGPRRSRASENQGVAIKGRRRMRWTAVSAEKPLFLFLLLHNIWKQSWGAHWKKRFASFLWLSSGHTCC